MKLFSLEINEDRDLDFDSGLAFKQYSRVEDLADRLEEV